MGRADRFPSSPHLSIPSVSAGALPRQLSACFPFLYLLVYCSPPPPTFTCTHYPFLESSCIFPSILSQLRCPTLIQPALPLLYSIMPYQPRLATSFWAYSLRYMQCVCYGKKGGGIHRLSNTLLTRSLTAEESSAPFSMRSIILPGVPTTTSQSRSLTALIACRTSVPPTSKTCSKVGFVKFRCVWGKKKRRRNEEGKKEAKKHQGGKNHRQQVVVGER